MVHPGWMVGGALASSALQSGGSKKAAKDARPQIPSQFRPAMGSALGLVNQGLTQGLPRYGGPFVAGLTPLQQKGIGAAGPLLGAGSEGLMSALQTTQNIAETGLDPESLSFIKKELDPFFSELRKEGVGGVREAQAAGGRFYGKGGVGAESRFLERFAAQQAAQILPLAMNIRGLQLGAAQTYPQILQGGMGAIGQGMGIGEVQRGVNQADVTANFQEFLRTQPQAMLPMLASLFGAPMGYNPQASNFQQVAGANLASLFTSPGFLSLFDSGGAGTDTD